VAALRSARLRSVISVCRAASLGGHPGAERDWRGGRLGRARGGGAMCGAGGWGGGMYLLVLDDG